VDRVALGQVYIRVLRFSPVSIILPLLHIHSFIIWGMASGHRDIVLPHHNNNSNTVIRHVTSYDQNNSRSRHFVILDFRMNYVKAANSIFQRSIFTDNIVRSVALVLLISHK
jgi:hypothetical protein